MTTDQFLFKARQGRMMQWLKSGKVEFIFMNRKGKVLAKDLVGIHHVHIGNKTNWDVRLVRVDEIVRLGSLMPLLRGRGQIV